MQIENLIEGVSVTTYDEGMDNAKNPAKIVIRDKLGKERATVYAVLQQIQGAGGGWYHAIKFEMRESGQETDGRRKAPAMGPAPAKKS